MTSNEKERLDKTSSLIKTVLYVLAAVLAVVLAGIAIYSQTVTEPPPVIDTSRPIEAAITYTTCDIYDEEVASGEVTIYTPDAKYKAFPFQLGGAEPTVPQSPE